MNAYDGYEGYSYESTSPRTFGEMPGLWTKILGMTTDFFAREAPRASGGVTIINVLIAAGISVVFAILSSIITMVISGNQSIEYSLGYIFGAGCGGFIFSLLGFYVGNGIYYLLARAFGGKGDFGTQTYLASLFIVPLTLITGILSLMSSIPCVNIVTGLITFGVVIFSVMLYVRVISATHNLDTGKSVAVVLIPIVLIFLLVCCLAVAGLVLFGPMVGEVFEEIMWELDNMYLLMR